MDCCVDCKCCCSFGNRRTAWLWLGSHILFGSLVAPPFLYSPVLDMLLVAVVVVVVVVVVDNNPQCLDTAFHSVVASVVSIF